ncbi:MAG TPA: hypothetical protein VGM26_18530 [Rhizomicrobium sp.]
MGIEIGGEDDAAPHRDVGTEGIGFSIRDAVRDQAERQMQWGLPGVDGL